MTLAGYTLWAVLRRAERKHPSVGSEAPPTSGSHTENLAATVSELAAGGVTVRGFYDVSGMRADADLMIWLHGSEASALQDGLRRLRRTALLSPLLTSWSAMGVHRDAEFTANHLPAFLRGTAPARWLTVYPFVRSYDWYLLPEDDRRAMLGQHGRKGSEYTSVLTNTVASFALGDYEWVLALEADDLVDLVDLMRHLRQTEARRHVRLETPFYTGRRIELSEIPDVLS